MIRAVVSEADLTPVEGVLGLTAALGNLAYLIRKVRLDSVNVYKHSCVWEFEVAPALKLYEILFQPGYVDDDIRVLTSIELERLSECDDVDGVKHENARSFAIKSLEDGVACALLVLPCRDRQEVDGRKHLFYVGTAASAIRFYRAAAEIGDFAEVDFIANALRAFPKLHFYEQITPQLGRFSESYRTMRSLIIQGLADLNDLLPPLIAAEMEVREIEKTFNAKSVFEISPESPQTHKNVKAMKERDVKFGNQTVRCEWHLKIHPNRDRIHFNFGSPTIAKGKVLIGIFTTHLT